MEPDIIIGVDAGTSMVKSVAFDLSGAEIAVSSVENEYAISRDGAATQSMDRVWADCITTINQLAEKISNLKMRVAAISITAQGDGTWLIDKENRPVTDAWLWLDSRAAVVVDRLRSQSGDQRRFELTGTGLNCCQQGGQLAFMREETPELLNKAEHALHCKDWLYLNMTGVVATDPSEASLTFGDFRTRTYSDDVIAFLGLEEQKRLLPEIVDGTQNYHPLRPEAARQLGLLAGTPVVLGYIDMICTALGGGVRAQGVDCGCSIFGSTGVHMRAKRNEAATLGADRTGYVMAFPIPGMVGQMQSNMAATLNVDWLLDLLSDAVGEIVQNFEQENLLGRIDNWLMQSSPGSLLYHPYIAQAGERGPFLNSAAKASFIGLSSVHRFGDMFRAVIEGLGFAARDCYTSMGEVPTEVRLTGGAARSAELRRVLSSTINTNVRICNRQETGAAGAAMIAAVAIGAYPDMDACIDQWVAPALGDVEASDPSLTPRYDKLFDEYVGLRAHFERVWPLLDAARST